MPFNILTKQETDLWVYFSLESSKGDQILKATTASTESIIKQILDIWNSKIQDLTMQGDFTKLLIEEQQSITWQSQDMG